MEGWNDRADCEKAGAGLGGAPRRQPSFHREVVVLLAVQSIIVLEIVVHHVDLVQGGEMSLQ